MPTYTFDVSPRSSREQLVTFTTDRESVALKQAMWYHNPGLWDDGHNRSKLIARRAELERLTPLSERLARQDLDAVGIYRR